MNRPHKGLIPTRRSLLDRLKNWNDQESWEEFFNLYWRLIYRAAIRAGLTAAEAQDVVQDTVIIVAKKMPRFSYDPAAGSFKRWLLRATRWKISDQFRRRIPIDRNQHPHLPGPIGSDPLEQLADHARLDVQSVWDELWDQNLFETALDRVKTIADHKQYQMFDLYVIKGWPARKVAATLHVLPARVYLAKHRISRLIRDQIKRLGQPVTPP